MPEKIKHTKTALEVQDLLMKYKVLFILILMCVIAQFISPFFMTGENILNIIRQVSTGGIVAIGFTIVLSSGMIDLSVGSILGLVGMIAAITSKVQGMPFIAVILIALASGAMLGFINGFLVNVMSVPAFIATLSTMSIFRGPVYIITNNAPIFNIPAEFTFIGQGYVGPIPFPIILFAIVVVVGYILLNRTTFGRHTIAMGGNANAARASGVNLKAATYGVFIQMGVFTAVAALIATGRANSAQPGAGAGMELDSVAAVVIGGTSLVGGIGNIIGTVIGVILVGVINNILNLTDINSNYQMIVKGLLIIFAIFIDVQSGKFREYWIKRQNTKK